MVDTLGCSGIKVNKRCILLGLFIIVSGCEKLQVNIPVEFQSIKRENASLLVLIENKTSLQSKISYPFQSGFLNPSQELVFSLPKAGNYRIVIEAYEKSRDYHYDYKYVSTIEIPIYLNGYDVININGRIVGSHIEVTNGMLFPEK